MILEKYIAKKINSEGNHKKSSPAVNIATVGVALGVAAMILALAVVIGFKNQVAEKATGFASHVRITGINDQLNTNTQPISVDDSICNVLLSSPKVISIGRCAEQSAVLKTNTDFSGIILKGVDYDYNTDFFKNALVSGNLPALSDSTTSKEILLSENIASKLQLNVGESVLCYFIKDENVKVRKFNISGIYNTNFVEYDSFFALCDLKTIQSVNNWESDQYTSLEIKLKDFDDTDLFTKELRYAIIGNCDKYGNSYFVESALEINPQLFNWLDLLDMNVWIILVLMSLVSGFTIISGTLIIILEKTATIGTLKAMGASDKLIRKTFVYLASYLILKGLLWGNVIGLSICTIQYFTGILKLDAATYYISEVPIEINWWLLILLNIGALALLMLMVTLPTHIISKIKPAETIRFE